jgi:hypothetical protein
MFKKARAKNITHHIEKNKVTSQIHIGQYKVLTIFFIYFLFFLCIIYFERKLFVSFKKKTKSFERRPMGSLIKRSHRFYYL